MPFDWESFDNKNGTKANAFEDQLVLPKNPAIGDSYKGMTYTEKGWLAPESEQPKSGFDWDAFDKKSAEKPVDEMMNHALGMSYGAGSLNKALVALPASAGRLAVDTGNALMHPVDSVKGLADVVGGGIGKLIPDALRTNDTARDIRQNSAFDAFTGRLGDRLGGVDKLRSTFENDPAGLLSDLSLLLSPISPNAASVINPVNMAVKGAKAAAPVIGGALADLIGGLGTKTGGGTLREAARAGLAGGDKSDAFLSNLSGDHVNMRDVLQVAEKGQERLRAKNYQDYVNNTASSFSDTTPLGFQKVRDAVARSNAMDITPEGIDLNPGTAAVKKSISDLVNEFDDQGLSTIRNLDELKRGVHNIVKNTDPQKTEYRAAMNVYGALKDTIAGHDPNYAKAMSQSQDALSLMDEISHELSLNPKAHTGTTIRKLQSTTRNNANTNYNHRVSLAKLLEDNGADNLNAMLSGQALSSWQPRGIAGAISGPTALGSYYYGGPAGAIAALGLQSPKLMGLLSYGAGATGRGINSILSPVSEAADKLGIDPALIANYLYQSNNAQ